MIREATLDDIPSMLDMGERFAAKAALPFEFCRESVGGTLKYLIEDDNGLCFVAADGAAGGLCHPHPYNGSVLVGQELFWWSEGREGAGLFDALEEGAKALGCQFWTMITLEAIRPKVIGRLYENRGYRPLEHSYIKEL